MEPFEPVVAEAPPAVEEPAEVIEEEPAAAKPKAKPRSRAVRGRGKKKPAAKGEDAGAEPVATAPAIAEPVAVVRTGSTDRHLIEDEPAFPQPVRRPKSVRDLDNIPDDFD
jgi:hypothetical protein